MNKIAITTLIFILCASLATAQIYKWRDENGKLVFSDSPPVSGPIAVPLKGSVKMLEVVSPEVNKSKMMAVDSDDLYRSNRAGQLFPSKGYVSDEVQNAKEYLSLLSSKNSLNAQDIMMTDYVRFVFEQPESKPYLDYGDSTSAKSLGRRGDAAKRSLSAKEKDMINLSMQMMVGRWESETYQEFDKSEINELDAILQRLWTQMCAAMADGNIDHTLSFFHSSTQSAYRKQFEAFSSVDLQRIAKDMSQQIQFVKDRGGLIEYALRIKRNGQVYSQIVNFQAEGDGQWKIRQF
jgi:hypothetical protein